MKNVVWVIEEQRDGIGAWKPNGRTYTKRKGADAMLEQWRDSVKRFGGKTIYRVRKYESVKPS